MLGIHGAMRVCRFLVCQLDSDGGSFRALPALYATLSTVDVYRFLVSRQGAPNQRIDLRARQQDSDAAALAVADDTTGTISAECPARE